MIFFLFALSTISHVWTNDVSLNIPREIHVRPDPFNLSGTRDHVPVLMDILIGKRQFKSFAVTIRDEGGDTVLITNLFPKDGANYFGYLENIRFEVMVPIRLVSGDQLCIVLLDIEKSDLIGEICCDVVYVSRQEWINAAWMVALVCLASLGFYACFKPNQFSQHDE